MHVIEITHRSTILSHTNTHASWLIPQNLNRVSPLFLWTPHHKEDLLPSPVVGRHVTETKIVKKLFVCESTGQISKSTDTTRHLVDTPRDRVDVVLCKMVVWIPTVCDRCRLLMVWYSP